MCHFFTFLSKHFTYLKLLLWWVACFSILLLPFFFSGNLPLILFLFLCCSLTISCLLSWLPRAILFLYFSDESIFFSFGWVWRGSKQFLFLILSIFHVGLYMCVYLCKKLCKNRVNMLLKDRYFARFWFYSSVYGWVFAF